MIKIQLEKDDFKEIRLKGTPKQLEGISNIFKNIGEIAKSGAIDRVENLFKTIGGMADKGPVFDSFSTMIEVANDKINAEQVEMAEMLFNTMGDPALARGVLEFVRVIRVMSGDLTALIGPIMELIKWLGNLFASLAGPAEGAMAHWEEFRESVVNPPELYVPTPPPPSGIWDPTDPTFPY